MSAASRSALQKAATKQRSSQVPVSPSEPVLKQTTLDMTAIDDERAKALFSQIA